MMGSVLNTCREALGLNGVGFHRLDAIAVVAVSILSTLYVF